jgi:hypothetical protein
MPLSSASRRFQSKTFMVRVEDDLGAVYKPRLPGTNEEKASTGVTSHGKGRKNRNIRREKKRR